MVLLNVTEWERIAEYGLIINGIDLTLTENMPEEVHGLSKKTAITNYGLEQKTGFISSSNIIFHNSRNYSLFFSINHIISMTYVILSPTSYEDCFTSRRKPIFFKVVIETVLSSKK